MNVHELSEQLRTGAVVILDGGCGTELGSRGIEVPPPLWSANALRSEMGRQATAGVHAAYIAAGAQIITANTFRTQRPAWDGIGEGASAAAATIAACRIAREAAERVGTGTIVAGSTTAIGDCYDPTISHDDATTAGSQIEHATALRRGGVDFMLAETIPTIREGNYALRAAAEVGLPAGISAYCESTRQGVRLPSGEPLSEAVAAWGEYGPIFVGVNCVSFQTAEDALIELTRVTRPDLALAVYANGLGTPNDNPHAHSQLHSTNTAEYVASAERWAALGAQIVGGCCMTSPEDIAALANTLGNTRVTNGSLAGVR